MNNPFTSSTFKAIWLKHFKSQKDEIEFKFIAPVTFYKHWIFPFYINIGKNLTKGVDYNLNYKAEDYKGKVCLVYDVPEYFKTADIDDSKTSLRCKKNFQYKGFALDLNDFPSQEEYIASRISSKNRRGYRSRLKRLEECFDIKYHFLYGAMDEGVFDTVFRQFHELLSKRFSEKEVNYHHLQSKKWKFYTELVNTMIIEKKASIFVIYNGKKPIGITLSFHSDDIAFVTITVFDPDYYKFNVGKTLLVKLLDWCYDKNVKIMDLSKGEFDFKYEWCNLVYDFEYHIIYDSTSLMARAMASLLDAYFNLKTYLRKKKVNDWYRKQLFKLKSRSTDTVDFTKLCIEYVDCFKVDESCQELNMTKDTNEHFKKFLYSFLFLNPEPEHNVKVYKSKNENVYFIKGKEKIQKVAIG